MIISSIACNTKMHQARIILLPDTQTYAEKFPEVLDSQINFILKEQKNISFVLQQGDLTQNNNDNEWGIIKAAFSKLDNKVPYVLAAGNHDMGSAPGKFADVRNSTLFNQYFLFSQMSRLPLFGGAFEQNKIDNSFYLAQTGKIKWLIITLEFGPRNEVLNWANNIVRQHPDRTVIINTHSYMYSDSTRQGPGDNWRPQAYGVGKDSGDSSVNDGEQIWEKLVNSHPNIRFVFSGQVLNTGVGTLASIKDHGYLVYQMLANYQEGVKGSIKGGNGWLRIVDMDFKKKTLTVSTYSPYINQFTNDAGQKFIIRNVLFKAGNK
jgi:3',5'-cyclic AMP phosphodiesterase CpdA